MIINFEKIKNNNLTININGRRLICVFDYCKKKSINVREDKAGEGRSRSCIEPAGGSNLKRLKENRGLAPGVMECFCAALKKAEECLEGEEECDHSYCTIQRQKKQCACVDLPPKGLPWSSGHLKYIPGQRNLYKDLVLDKQEEQRQEPCVVNLCKPKAEKKCGEAEKACLCCCGSASASKKKKKKKRYKGAKGEYSGSRPTSQQQPQGRSCCIEFEEVYVCDGAGSEPRKGFLVKSCRRPEVCQAVAAAQDETEKIADEDEAAAEQGVICLCIPRAYLQRRKTPQEDLCGAPQDCPDQTEKPLTEDTDYDQQ